ncbi:MAG: penicillin-binding protein 2 [Clostridia bacterium]|nr:penicillin-binding protein 2 [Clostridia bacterium]
MAKRKKNKINIKLRFNVLTILIYIVGIILIARLFTLQIIHGEEYKEQSNTRLTRESTIEAARGNFLDRTGVELVTSKMEFSLEMYKSKVDTENLNKSILNMIQVLEKNECSYSDTFPIKIEPFEYTIENEALINWKKNNNLDDDITAEQAFYKFKNKYKIENTDDIQEIRKIITIRYLISQKGYSSTKSVTIAENIPNKAVAEFSESSEKFAGINIVTKPVREYTSGNLASHILGYASRIDPDEYEKRKSNYSQNDIIGKTGIEAVFEEYLKGKNGTKQIDMAVDGTTTAEYIAKEAVAGSDIVLTIDANLQKITEDALVSNIQKIASGDFGKAYDAKAGAAVVMNVNTGEVLAMASYPDYTPADFVGGISNENWAKYRDNTSKPLVNKAMQNSYSPGSTFKMVTAIAGLESNTINLSTKINDTGIYKKYRDFQPRCWIYTDYHIGHGYLDVSGAIEKSCNYFFYETADKMGIENLVKYAKYFGLGNKTGIELPSETAGALASKETWSKLHPQNEPWGPGQVLQAAIGQSDNEFSPLQMARYISMLANGGQKVDVSIVKTIRNADGSEVSREEINQFINKKLGLEQDNTENLEINQNYLKAVLEGMKSVTSDTSGTAYIRFKDFDITVGGKTGSAEAPNNQVHAWFVGFAPFEDPEIAIVVMVENGGHGNYTAEVVRNIMAEYFGMNVQNVEEDMRAIPYVEIIN